MFQFSLIISFIIFNMINCFLFSITSQSLHPLQNLKFGGMGIGDFNGDGLSDFMVGGISLLFGTNFFLFKQNSSLQFYDITNTGTFPEGLPLGFKMGRPIFVDMNKDGVIDLFYSGDVTIVYLQIGFGSVFMLGNSVCFPSGLPSASGSFSDVADADDAGYFGLLLVGSNIPFFLFHQNSSTGVYENVSNAFSFPGGLPASNMDRSNVRWRDFDNDDKLDFILVGYSLRYLFRQNLTGVFYNVWNTVSFPAYASITPQVVSGNWVDYDGNGRASLREVVRLFTFSPNLLHLSLHSSTLLRTSRSEPWVVIIQGILYLVTSMVIRCWTCLLWRIWDHWCLGHGMFLISLQIIRLEQMLPRTMM